GWRTSDRLVEFGAPGKVAWAARGRHIPRSRSGRARFAAAAVSGEVARMNRLCCVIAVALAMAAGVRAAEVDHLEFIRGLRARNYPDLALEYLDELAKKPGLPPALGQQLPFERAKTLLDLASTEPEPGKQAALYAETQQQLEAFIRAHAASPLAAEANLELARILVQQAKAKLHKARLEEGGASAD